MKHMHNSKKMLKFLSLLISAIVFTSNSNLNTNARIETSAPIKEENNMREAHAQGEELKPITKEQWEKEQKNKYDLWKQNVKIDEKKEKEFLERNIKKYKNFKKEAYEHPNYDLTVYFKNGVPILHYEHKVTKTKIVVVPVENLNNVNIKDFVVQDRYIFNAFVPDDSGFVHFVEHCLTGDLALNFGYKQSELRSYFNAYTTSKNLFIQLNENSASYKFTKELFKTLKHPKCLDDEKIFEREKGRILYETLEHEMLDELYPSQKEKQNIYYNYGGNSKEIVKVSIKRIREFIKNILHPSNLLITKQILELSPKKMLDYLNLLNEEYLKDYEYKKIEVPKFRKKKDYNYKKEKYVDDLEGGITYDILLNKKECKYWANIELLDYDNEKDRELILKHPILGMPFFRKDGVSKIVFELEEFIKSLGYDAQSISSLSEVRLYGNKKELFEKEALQKAYKKIYEFVTEKIKNFTDKDIERNVIGLTNYNMVKNEKVQDIQMLFANPMFYKRKCGLTFLLQDNFSHNKDLFSKEVFDINEKNEIIDSKQNLIKTYMEDIKNLDKFKNRKPYKITVYEQGNSIKRTEKYRNLLKNFNKPFLLPLEFKKNKENVTLTSLARNFLVDGFLAQKTTEIIPTHSRPFLTSSFAPYMAFSVSISKKYQQKELDYYEKKNFEKDLKNLKISEEEFKNLKKNMKKNVNLYIENFKAIKKRLKTIENSINYYLEHGLDENAEVYDEKKGNFKIDKKTTRGGLYHTIVCCLPTFFKNFEEEMEYERNITDFSIKYGQKDYEKYREILIDKDFVKELKEKVLKPVVKAFKYNEEITKKVSKEIDGVKFKDFVETVKSCGLVDKDKYEKDQKSLDSVREKTLQIII